MTAMFRAFARNRPTGPTHPDGLTPNVITTGLSDVTAGLNSFFAGLSDGAVVNLAKNARYRADGTLTLTADGVTINGNGATLFTNVLGAQSRAHIRLDKTADTTIRYLNIQGPNVGGSYVTARAFQHGIGALGCDNLLIEHCTVQNVYGDFFYLGEGTGDTPTTNATIQDNVCSQSGRQGIAVVAADGFTVRRNLIARAGRSTIDLEPGSGSGNSVLNGVFDRNTFYGGRLNWIAANGHGQVDHMTVTNNTVHPFDEGGPELEGGVLSIDAHDLDGGRREDWTVTGNTAYLQHGRNALSGEPAGATMRFVNFDDLTVRTNAQPMQSSRPMYLVAADGCTALDIAANTGANLDGQFFEV